jgi:transposase-like protein
LGSLNTSSRGSRPVVYTIDTEFIERKRDERGRKITPRSEREVLVRAYRQSGLTQKAFAQREGVKFATFVSWLQDVRRREEPPKVSFAELTAPGAMSAPRATLEVQLPDGTTIRGGNAEELARLLRLLRC